MEELEIGVEGMNKRLWGDRCGGTDMMILSCVLFKIDDCVGRLKLGRNVEATIVV